MTVTAPAVPTAALEDLALYGFATDLCRRAVRDAEVHSVTISKDSYGEIVFDGDLFDFTQEPIMEETVHVTYLREYIEANFAKVITAVNRGILRTGDNGTDSRIVYLYKACGDNDHASSLRIVRDWIDTQL